MEIKFLSKSHDDSKKIAHKIISKVKEKFGDHQGVIFLLQGELGSGKTKLIKFFVEEILGKSDFVFSPTFTIINEYPNKILHIDLYRVDDLGEILAFSQEKAYSERYTVFFEWGEKIPSQFLEKAVKIKIDFGNEDNERKITMIIPD